MYNYLAGDIYRKKRDNMANQCAAISKKDRFDLKGCKTTMKAVVTNGNGGYEKLEYRDVPVPALGSGEVLLQVLAAGVNNTEINTRLGWYSSAVTTGTEAPSAGEKEKAKAKADGGWNEATPFPFIQGTDCCGRVVAVAPGGDERTIGLRVLVRPCIRSSGWKSLENIWMASDFDGAFAQFVKWGPGRFSPWTAIGAMPNLVRSHVPTVRLKTWFTGRMCPGASMYWSLERRAVSGRLSCSWRSVGRPL